MVQPDWYVPRAKHITYALGLGTLADLYQKPRQLMQYVAGHAFLELPFDNIAQRSSVV